MANTRSGSEPGANFFEALYDISCELTSSLNLERVLNNAMDRVIELTHAERGFIMLADGGGEMTCAIARNIDRQSVKTPNEISRSVVDQVIRERQPVLSMNAQQDERFSDQSSVIAYGLRSLACAPLIAHDQLIGVVYVDNRLKVGTFRPQDVDLLMAFANITAIAIANARLYEDIKRGTDEQLRLRDELHRQELARALAEEVSQCKTLMVNFLSHEIMQPITTIKGFLGTLERDRDGAMFPVEERLDFYSIMTTQCDRLLFLCSDMLDNALIESGRPLKLKLKQVDLSALLTLAVRAQQRLIGDTHVFELILPPQPCLIVADEGKVNQIVHNLISNAIKYSPDGGTIEIRLEELQDRARVHVKDPGLGMTAEQVARLFRPYERPTAESAPRITGHGLGLFLVKRILEAHGGNILVVSEPGQGSTFTFELPRRTDGSLGQ